MKHNLLFAVAILALTSCAFGQKKAGDIYSGYVRYDGSDAVGSITVISTGFGKKKLESTQDAFKEAFYALLFRGIPGSQYELPMVADESGKKDDPVVKELLKGGYTSFVTQNSLQGEENKVKKADGVKGKMTTYKITINCEALKRYLEQNKVIRKFGI